MWYDAHALDVLRALRDQFDVQAFVETGTHLGIGTRLWSMLFQEVYSCDLEEKFLNSAMGRTGDRDNVFIFRMNSPEFLALLRRFYRVHNRADTPIIYLDAHWGEYWPILDELRALAECPRCIVIIHDYKVVDMGYDSYGGIDLDLGLVRNNLRAVNPGFHLYTNSRQLSVPVDPGKWLKTYGGRPGDMEMHATLTDALRVDWTRYRGTLYALPAEMAAPALLNKVVTD